MQRDRTFEHYQDLDSLRTEAELLVSSRWRAGARARSSSSRSRPPDETNDNIVAQWAPIQPMEPGSSRTWRYKITRDPRGRRDHAGRRGAQPNRTKPRALGSAEPATPNSTRFIIDFTDGQLPFYAKASPTRVQVVPSISNGRILRTFLVPNPKTEGFRAGIDVEVPAGQSADIRAFLKAGNKALTENLDLPVASANEPRSETGAWLTTSACASTSGSGSPASCGPGRWRRSSRPGGHVRVNGQRAEASSEGGQGRRRADDLAPFPRPCAQGARRAERRGPASEAEMLYEEL